MRGIILAGGSGTRLHPLTFVVSKQLMPVYDKPMIYYPLSTLMLAGIRDILIISTPSDLPMFQSLLKDGSQLGITLSYREQPAPGGLAQAFLIGKSFIREEPVALILGDNIFFGHGLLESLRRGIELKEGAMIFGYPVRDPQRYGVLEFDPSGRAVGIEEKPLKPLSRYAVPGIYFYDGRVSSEAARLTPSERGELEITDLNLAYMGKGLLQVEKLGRGIAWLDTGTHESLLEASNFIEAIENRQGLKVACLEEVAYRMGYIGAEDVRRIGRTMAKNGYGQYLLSILDGDGGSFESA
ncbi:MAG: glucose-1-phosphate thymidylyltransferase RfbA [Leptospirales bacterium]